MRITTARRIAQLFFFSLFIWLCLAATVGPAWWQWRGWPVAWFLQLDPLVAVGTVLTTHSFHPLLAWSLAIIALTIVFGRVFCGFICPLGALHQFVGWLGRRVRKPKDKMAANTYRPAQAIKYYLLVVLLTWMAAGAILSRQQPAFAVLPIGWLDPMPLLYRSFDIFVLPAGDAALQAWFPSGRFHTGAGVIGAAFIALVLMNLVIPRFFCRILCPLGALLGLLGRFSPWSIGKTGAACTDCGWCDVDCEGACNPTGPLRVSECLMCMNCLETCPRGKARGQRPEARGAAGAGSVSEPMTAATGASARSRSPRQEHPLAYRPRPSTGGEIAETGVSRRGFMAAVVTGVAAVPLARLDGRTRTNGSPGLIRPPGSVAEDEFLARCLKCTACMRVCPTNTLQPAGSEHGWEAVWTPVLNNRIGTSGCQLACIACGHACPTGAIRPLTLAEKQGTGEFAGRGPIRIGLAAVDRGRCLPWANDRPCIVCEENCPVTPKAITVSEIHATVRDGKFEVVAIEGATLRLRGAALEPGRFASGDYFARIGDGAPGPRIVANTSDTLTLDAPLSASADGAQRSARPTDSGENGDAENAASAAAGSADSKSSASPAARGSDSALQTIEIQVRLQRPVVDPSRCIGCGVCEHECPFLGLRAIRVTADNETRGGTHGVLLKREPAPPAI